MNAIRNLVLGSTAALLAVTGAQAADLPVKAKAVEYVRICSLYGAGFFYIPGTDTCIKLGGYLRVDTTFNGGIHGTPAWNGDIGEGDRYRDYFASRSRMALTIDTRTATEYGVVRTFGQGDFQFSTQGSTTVNPGNFTASPSAGTQTNLLNEPGEGYAAVATIRPCGTVLRSTISARAELALAASAHSAPAATLMRARMLPTSSATSKS